MSDVVIRVENVSKEYRLGVIGHGTLSKDLQSRWARFRGKEDPNAKIDYTTSGPDTNERFWALKDISFDVHRGEVVGIIGRNGAGKSTLLKILSRVTTPTTGIVKVKGRIASLLEVGTGFHPELTGRENVFLNGAILGMTRREVEEKFDEIVRFAEIEKFIDTPVKRYSSGMYVRLAFAVAAHLEPEILLVDEVLAVGDASFQKKCLGKMGDVAKEGRTVLFVSHNMNVILSLCERSIYLLDGKLCEDGPTKKVIDSYLSILNSSSEQKNEIFWKSNEHPPSCEEMCLCSIRLLNSLGIVQDFFSVNEQIFVEITYQVKILLRGMRIELHLMTDEGTNVFASVDQDQRPNTLHSGYYRSILSIPSGLLNQKRYFIRIQFAIPGIRILIRGMEYLSFYCNSDVIENSYLSCNWPGVVAPKLQWSFEKIEQPNCIKPIIKI